MTSRHLSENEIQLHITENLKLSQDHVEHLQSCAICRNELNEYLVIFAKVKDSIRPAFEFDLADMVIKKIPTVKPKFPWLASLVVLSVTLFFMITFINFSSYLIQILKTLPTTYFFIIVISSLLVLLFQGFDAVKKYREKTNLIRLINSCNNTSPNRSHLI